MLVILVLLHPTSGVSEIHFDFQIQSEIAEILVTEIINQLELIINWKGDLINEHALNHEPVPLNLRSGRG